MGCGSHLGLFEDVLAYNFLYAKKLLAKWRNEDWETGERLFPLQSGMRETGTACILKTNLISNKALYDKPEVKHWDIKKIKTKNSSKK